MPDPQQREFAWDGRTFKQVGGSVRFPERQPADLSVTAGPLNLGPVRNGKRAGTVSVTVKNLGPNLSHPVEIQCSLAGPAVVDGNQYGTTRKPALQPGQTGVYQVQVEVPAENADIALRVSIRSYVVDPVSDNNFVNVAVNRA